MRPRAVVVVTGTGTEVGKTWLGVEVIKGLREREVSVAARKPAQSFEPGKGKTDAELLAAASGEPPDLVCPTHRWYPAPMAPPMAAESLGMSPPLVDDLLAETAASWPDLPVDIGLVEGAGGVASPIATDGDTATLAKALEADMILLVAEAGLGTINMVRLSRHALDPLPVVVYLNRFDAGQELHVRNRDWLLEIDGLDLSWQGDDLVARLVARLVAPSGV